MLRESEFCNSSREIKRIDFRNFALLSVIIITLSSADIAAQTTFTANTSGNWTTVTWVKTGPSLASYPGQPGYAAEIHDAVIDGAAITVTLDANIVSSVRNVTLNSGTLNISANALTMTGNLSGPGTLAFTSGTLNIGGDNTTTAAFNPGTGTINYNGGNQSVRGIIYYNLVVSGTGIKTLSANTTVSNNFTINSGVVQAANRNFSVNNGVTTIFSGGEFTANSFAGTKSFRDVVLSGGTLNSTSGVAETMNISGNLVVDNNAVSTIGNITITVTGTTQLMAGATLSIGGTNGTKIFNGLVTITGSWSNLVNENCSFNNGLTFNGTSFVSGTGTYYFNTNSQTISGTSPVTFDGNVIVNTAGITLNNATTITIKGLLGGVNPSAWNNNAGSVLNCENATAPMNGLGRTLNASANPNIVNYSGTVNQSVKATTYHNLSISGSGTKTLPGAVTVNGNLSVTGTANLATNEYQITGNNTGTLTMDSETGLFLGNPAVATSISFPTNFMTANILLHPNSTVTYQAYTDQPVSAMPVYGHLTTSASGTKTLEGNITVAGNLTIGTNTTLDASLNNYNITVAGSWICNGTFNENQGKVIFNGAGPQSIVNTLVGTEYFYDLEFSTVGPVTSTADLFTTNNLTMTGGIILMPGRTFLLGTDVVNPGILIYSSGWFSGIFSRWTAPVQNGLDLLFPVGDNTFGRNLTLNFTNIATGGVLSVNFNGTTPTTSGLPLTEGMYTFNQLFPEGYWNLLQDATFAFTGSFDLEVVPSGFTTYTIDGNTRIVSRFTASDWFLNGVHVSGSPALLLRNSLGSFTNDYAVANAEICDPAFINCPADVVVNNLSETCGNTVFWTPPTLSGPCSGYTITSNYNPGDYFDVGTTHVVYYSWSGTTKVDSCEFNVAVIDIEPPVVLCRDINLYIGDLGTATLTGSDIDNGSHDNCFLLLVPDKTNFTCADVGLTIPVLLTGIDPSGNSADCTALVTVRDTIHPIINTKPFTVMLDNSGTGTLLASDIDNGTYDNCTSITLSVSPGTFSCADQGLKMVTFTAVDSYGNTATSSVQITVASSLTINSTSLSSCNLFGPNALYKSDVTGGDGNYSYFWDGLDDSVNPFVAITSVYPFLVFSNTSTAETPFFNNLMPDGTYTIRLIVTDGNGCIDSMDMIIVKSGLVYNNITVRYSAACEGTVTSYTVNSDPDATYNWGVENGTILTTPLDTNKINVLWNSGVTRGVVITTASKIILPGGDPCESSVVDTVTINPLPGGTITSQTNVSCFGGNDGGVTVSGSGGTAPYEYSLNGGTYQSSGTFNSLVAGSYTVTVRDVNLCTIDVPVIITEPSSALGGNITAQTNVDCFGNSSGSVTVAGSGGTSPYMYSLDGGGYQASGTFSGLVAGNHSVTIRDANICTFSIPVTITQPSVLTGSIASQINVACFGEASGQVTIAGGGGTIPYQYSLDGGPNQASPTFMGLAAGSYTITILDANLCTFGVPVTITQPAAALTVTTTQVDVICFGETTGSATAIPAGGTGLYTYSWNTVPGQTTATATNLAAGPYIVTVTDANNCFETATVIINQPAAAITGSASVTTAITCNGGTATVTLTGSGGTAPYSYTFDGVTNGTGVFPGIAAGVAYAWSITDASLCSPATGTLDVTEPAAITGSASVTTAILCNGGTATVTLTGSGGTAPYSYTFNGVTNGTGVFSGVAAGVAYVWSITDAGLCSPATGTLDVTEPAAITGSASVTTAIICNGGTATVTLTGSGGTAPLSYTFNGVTNGTGVFPGVAAGVAYAWSITDVGLCGPVTGTLDVTEPAAITGSASVTTAIACSGGTAMVTLTGSGGTAPLSYTFDGVTNGTGVFPGIAAGVAYAWSITDASLCSPATGTLDVTEPAAITGSASVTTAITCNGGTATVTLTGSGGTAPYSYTFDGVTNGTGVFSGVAAGVAYAWSITDASLCSPATGTLDVTEPAAITGSASVTTAILCNGGTATVTLTGSGGTAPLSYTFNGVTNGTGVFSGIAAGVAYAWSITDAGLCSPATGTLDVTEPAAITGSASVTTAIICNGGTATVTLTGSGGTAPLSYTFNGVTNGTGVFPGVAAGVSYAWSITDASLCGPLTGTLDVTEPAAITGSASVTTAIACSGGTATVTLTGSGGTAPLSYTFDGVTNGTGVFPGIAAGVSYAWSITDASLCGPLTGTLDVTEPAAITGSASVTTAITCNGGTATVTLTGSGGTAPYSYTFDGVTNGTGVFPGIAAGVAYAWSITDASLCSPATGTLDVTEPAAITGSASVTTAILCNGGTATVTLTGSGGTAPLSYTFNGVANGTGVFSGITAGVAYAWSITDASLCGPVTGTLDITEPTALSGVITSQINVSTFGGNDGSVTVDGSGGSAPYQYRLDAGAYQASGTFTTLIAGSYTVTIEDINLCTFEVPVTITQPPGPLDGTITSQNNVLCFGGNTGIVTVTGVEGIPPYEYSLNTGSYQASGTFGSLTAGIYTVTVRDALLATHDVPVTISEPSQLSVTTTQVDVLCFGSATGSATATAAGGIEPYTYSWNTIPVQTTATASDLPAATYTVTVTDANNCTVAASVTISQPSKALTVALTQVNVSCSGGSDGSADATASGGIGPYTYSWNTSPVQTTSGISGLNAGVYTVTVTDFAGCTSSVIVTITEPQELSVVGSSINSKCPDSNDGTISLTITGGSAPYIVIWSDGNTNPNRTGLLPGTYSVIVTDQNACAAPLDVTVDFDGTFECVSIPQVITPNGDGKNDTWIIRNIDIYPDAEILVFTRWGKLIFRTKNPLANQWDGTFNNGRLVPTDSYHYILYLNDGSEPRSGVISVIR